MLARYFSRRFVSLSAVSGETCCPYSRGSDQGTLKYLHSVRLAIGYARSVRNAVKRAAYCRLLALPRAFSVCTNRRLKVCGVPYCLTVTLTAGLHILLTRACGFVNCQGAMWFVCVGRCCLCAGHAHYVYFTICQGACQCIMHTIHMNIQVSTVILSQSLYSMHKKFVLISRKCQNFGVIFLTFYAY